MKSLTLKNPIPSKHLTVDEYFSALPPEAQVVLEQLRKTIRLASPQAEEVISYNMPAFKFHGILVYYAAQKNHIGFYPTASPIKAFMDELKDYKVSKGAIQFSMDKPIPKTLVKKIVQFRVAENLRKAKPK
jgi:uncharacterized protein YdhG (YjbR/CyaY superfamily)